MGRWLATQLQSNNEWAAELHRYKQMVKQQQSSADGTRRSSADCDSSSFLMSSMGSGSGVVIRNEPIFHAIFTCLVNIRLFLFTIFLILSPTYCVLAGQRHY